MAAIEAGISENFLLMNDDFYMLKNFTAARYPYYYRGEIPFIPDEIQNKIDFWLKQGNNNAYFKTHSTNKTPTQRKKYGFLDILFGDVRFITVKQKKSDIDILNTLSEIDDD